jgi:FkbM family methyltransferase
VAEKFGYSVISIKSLEAMKERLAEVGDSKNAVQMLGLLLSMKVSNVDRFIKFGKLSKAQLLQDLFVLEVLNFKQNGFFVEFGAADGVKHSNSYLLEKEFGWTGILAEPATIWHSRLESIRTAKIEKRCVWNKSNENLEFSEDLSAELSSPTLHRNKGIHAGRRVDAKNYQVITVSLRDLLHENKAPREIDYLSIDTEGSEYQILHAFDWSEFDFRVITVEHNFSEDRESISELLTSVGYRQVYRDLSNFDDWYIHKDLSEF